jgi:hypothetical protein
MLFLLFVFFAAQQLCGPDRAAPEILQESGFAIGSPNLEY